MLLQIKIIAANANQNILSMKYKLLYYDDIDV